MEFTFDIKTSRVSFPGQIYYIYIYFWGGDYLAGNCVRFAGDLKIWRENEHAFPALSLSVCLSV